MVCSNHRDFSVGLVQKPAGKMSPTAAAANERPDQ